MAFAAELEGVSHRYGKTVALDGVTLRVPAGCMAGLIGPDGVGKSTLLGLISGVRKAQSGKVVALGADMSDRAARAGMQPRIAYMPQGLGRNLYPTLTVRENLDFFGRLFGQKAGERDQRIHMLLDATGLAPFPDRPAGKLSGGMKQKLSLCCSLIHDPDLLILDEPTTGVDPLSRRQFWDLIDSIRERMPDMSVIVATAYMDEAERFDWLAAMDGGKVIAEGAPKELMERAGAKTLDDAFIALLPEAERAEHKPVELRPRVPSSDKAPAIEAHNLTMRFGDFTAVDDVSFEIPEGEIFGFLGSNGCGKSTTMKMLTGLLTPTEGTTKLFGEPLGRSDMQARLRIGYMSQSFSLYSELSVRQNLDLHAKLYGVPRADRAGRVTASLKDYELDTVADQMPEDLPLGIRQRLQLAVATIHEPRILILDEPTSGVDPVARDGFWRKLISLSRDKGVTIFISTHFMNEAARCDRISLMHAGKVLAVGTPAELTEKRGAKTLEEAFIAYLEDEIAADPAPEGMLRVEKAPAPSAPRAALTRLWAYATRETMELLRDPIRLFFALLGPVILMITVGFGISFDVNRLSFAVEDQDQTAESRRLAEQFSAIRQFGTQDPLSGTQDMMQRMGRGDLAIALEIPDGFGKELRQGKVPEVSIWLDGSLPFRAETSRAYALGVMNHFADLTAQEQGGAAASQVDIETRFLFNQAFRSANAMVPSVIMLILFLIPAIMAAIGVVREVETGTIANFRSTPVTRLEFLLGKQLPYLVISVVNFVVLFVLGLLIFQVPFTGSFWTLAGLSVIYVAATTGFGLLISTFTKTQVAAVFATAVLSILPTVNFSGLIVPVSSLQPASRMIGFGFPGSWYQQVTQGTFVKGFGWGDLGLNALVLTGFALAYLALAVLALRKQEA
ncbi:ribosome-associated ATPase/putative transporter RbbA [Paenirhodobacter populi]|uniref:ribosome-associated ATPase/putative transporter RbbA n=1 Tax=Paenirhodobacter populi TaxID=2306993 RepID=UPI000FE39B92|nr:ribosome-associated ATPase/putative transporter RbbA [Sinirhodobacter populi]RWR11616.1 ABC transporter ATP-binding protein/permease [Sinirhodobacter populi]